MKTMIAMLGLTMVLSAGGSALADDAANAASDQGGSAVVAGSLPCDDSASKDCTTAPATTGTAAAPAQRTIQKHGR